MELEEFRKLLEDYGADYQNTMARFMNNETLYIKFLDMFFKDENMNKLGTALDSGNLKEAFEIAHTLKGVVANMGLAPLLKAVCVIVEPLRSGDKEADYGAAYQVIQDEYRKAEVLRGALKGVV